MNDPTRPSEIGDQEPENTYPDRIDSTMGDTLDDTRDPNMLKQIFIGRQTGDEMFSMSHLGDLGRSMSWK